MQNFAAIRSAVVEKMAFEVAIYFFWLFSGYSRTKIVTSAVAYGRPDVTLWGCTSCRFTVSCELPFTTNVTISTSISQIFRSWVARFHLRQPMVLFISQLIRHARACSSNGCFILRAARLSSKLLRQGYVVERLKSSLKKFYGRYGVLIKHYEVSLSHGDMTFWDMTIYNDTLNWSDITPICECITEPALIPMLTLLPNIGGFHRTLQRVRLANRGRLLLRTPGPVPFGTCICSYVETILSWTCHVYGPFEFRTSLGTSILPFKRSH